MPPKPARTRSETPARGAQAAPAGPQTRRTSSGSIRAPETPAHELSDKVAKKSKGAPKGKGTGKGKAATNDPPPTEYFVPNEPEPMQPAELDALVIKSNKTKFNMY